MHRIKMLVDCKGSLNGYDVILFCKGEEYDVNQELFDAYVNVRGVAVDLNKNDNDKKNAGDLFVGGVDQKNKAPKKIIKKKE